MSGKTFDDQGNEIDPDTGRIISLAESIDPAEQPIEWSLPTPLGKAGDLPTFPVDVLPDWLARMVSEVSANLQTPPDLAAMFALSIVAAGAGGRVGVDIEEGWSEPASMYLACGMNSGTMKSVVLKLMNKPLEACVSEVREQARPAIREALTRRKIAEAIADNAEKSAGNGNDTDRKGRMDDAVAKRLAADEIEVPVEPKLLVDDATPEALTTFMAEHGGRAAILSAEAATFTQMAGQYSDKSNLNIYLHAYDGGTVRVIRRGREEELKGASLSIGVAVQPSVLEDIGANRQMRGRGLVARFLFSLPKDIVGYREKKGVPFTPGTRVTYEAKMTSLVRALLNADPDTMFDITPEAHEALIDFRGELEPQLRPGARLSQAIDWGSKLHGNTARLALLIHLLHTMDDGWGSAVSVAAMEKAVRVARYYIEHTLAVFDLMGATENIVIAKAILKWVKRTQQPGDLFTRRDMHRGLDSQLVEKAAQLDDPIQVLMDLDWLAHVPHPPRQPGQKGASPSPRFTANPAVWVDSGVSVRSETVSVENSPDRNAPGEADEAADDPEQRVSVGSVSSVVKEGDFTSSSSLSTPSHTPRGVVTEPTETTQLRTAALPPLLDGPAEPAPWAPGDSAPF